MRFLLLAAVLFLFSGCVAARYVEEHPNLTERVRGAILNGQIGVGMTEEQVRVSWHDRFLSKVYKDSEGRKVLVYGSPSYGRYFLYFKGGQLAYWTGR